MPLFYIVNYQYYFDLLTDGKVKEAIDKLERTIIENAAFLSNIYFQRIDDKEKASQILANAIKICPSPELYNNLAFILSWQNKLDEALKVAEEGIQNCSPMSDLYFTKAIILKKQSKPKECEEVFRKALELKPDCSIISNELGFILLCNGKYREGFSRWQNRFEIRDNNILYRRKFAGKDWSGEEILGKTLLIFNEQGNGDLFQYIRYLPKLKTVSKANIVLETKPELISLLSNQGYQVINWDKEKVEHDYVVSICSLPLYLDPDLENIPLEPYMVAKSKVLEGKFKIGIIWAGSQYHFSDRNRSCYLKYFKPLTNFKEIQLISLQIGNSVRSWTKGYEDFREGREMEVVDLMEGVDFPYLTPEINDFNDTAMLLKGLDLLISVDTSAVHLAGALGCKVWMLKSYYFDWRWKKTWYPTMKIFTQPKAGDWESVFKEVCVELEKIFK